MGGRCGCVSHARTWVYVVNQCKPLISAVTLCIIFIPWRLSQCTLSCKPKCLFISLASPSLCQSACTAQSSHASPGPSTIAHIFLFAYCDYDTSFACLVVQNIHIMQTRAFVSYSSFAVDNCRRELVLDELLDRMPSLPHQHGFSSAYFCALLLLILSCSLHRHWSPLSQTSSPVFIEIPACPLLLMHACMYAGHSLAPTSSAAGAHVVHAPGAAPEAGDSVGTDGECTACMQRLLHVWRCMYPVKRSLTGSSSSSRQQLHPSAAGISRRSQQKVSTAGASSQREQLAAKGGVWSRRQKRRDRSE